MAVALLTLPPAGPALDPLDLEAALTALLDRDETAPPDHRARLRRVRHRLEAELAELLAA